MFDWKGALARAKNETALGGQGDWRLPNVVEMATLLVYGAEANAVTPPQFFPRNDFTVAAGSGRIFWCSTTDIGDPARAYKATFDGGIIHNVDADLETIKKDYPAFPTRHNPARVWLVRGPIDGRE